MFGDSETGLGAFATVRKIIVNTPHSNASARVNDEISKLVTKTTDQIGFISRSESKQRSKRHKFCKPFVIRLLEVSLLGAGAVQFLHAV